MSTTSPADLAITFRSVPRRVREALGDDLPASGSGSGSELHDQLAQAASLLGTATDATAIADGIERTRADAWDSATLDSLRAIALEVGQQLRRLAAQHRHDDG